jgi:hypothetical protein
MIKLLRKSEYFILSSRQNKKGKKTYRIALDYRFDSAELPVLRDIVDPLRNRGGVMATSWKFRHLPEAEKMFTMLVLRWG